MTETAPPRADRWIDLGVVGTIVDQRISQIQRLREQPTGIATLARLRRGVGKPPGAVQDILEYTLNSKFAEGAVSDDPTPGEHAAHVAMTLYALHQQSQRQPMHRRGFGFGRSIRELNGPDVDGPPNAVRRRFNALGTSDTLDELVHHARGIVQLLRSSGIPLDYGLLADQLVRWRTPAGRDAVRLVWGRGFYRTTTPDQKTTPAEPDTSAPEGE